MPQVVCSGAMCMCSFGAAPCTLNVTSQAKVMVGGKPCATIQDSQKSNLPTFGMCSSLANPQVASATAAALGVLTPQPCMLMPAGPWIPKKGSVFIDGKMVLTNDSKLICTNGMGNISITVPGQVKTIV